MSLRSDSDSDLEIKKEGDDIETPEPRSIDDDDDEGQVEEEVGKPETPLTPGTGVLKFKSLNTGVQVADLGGGDGDDEEKENESPHSSTSNILDWDMEPSTDHADGDNRRPYRDTRDYIHRRPSRPEDRSSSQASGVSTDWQHSGLTRSELQYSRSKLKSPEDDETGSTSSSSMVWTRIHKEGGRIRKESGHVRSTGVQTMISFTNTNQRIKVDERGGGRDSDRSTRGDKTDHRSRGKRRSGSSHRRTNSNRDVQEKIAKLFESLNLLTEYLVKNQDGKSPPPALPKLAHSPPPKCSWVFKAPKSSRGLTQPKHTPLTNGNMFNRIEGGHVSDSRSQSSPKYQTYRIRNHGKERGEKLAERSTLKAPPPISYYIPFPKTESFYSREEPIGENGCKKQEELINLQEAFQKHCPSFIERAREREEIIEKVRNERREREEKKREWVRENYVNNEGFEKWKAISALDLPPRGPRLMTVKEMKELTLKNYKNLPEVRERVLQKKSDEEKRTNRIMTQLFSTNLRKGVLRGKMNIDHYRSLIRKY